MSQTYKCYDECGKYFDELVDYGKEARDQGKKGEETMNLVGGSRYSIPPLSTLLTVSRPDA